MTELVTEMEARAAPLIPEGLRVGIIFHMIPTPAILILIRAPEDSTWEKAENCKNATTAVQEYHDRVTRMTTYLVLEATKHDDIVIGSAVGWVNMMYRHEAESAEHLFSTVVLDAFLELSTRIAGPPGQTTVEWWGARAEARSLETLCLTGAFLIFLYAVTDMHRPSRRRDHGPEVLASRNLWMEIVRAFVHITLMVVKADLTLRVRRACVHGAQTMALRTLANEAVNRLLGALSVCTAGSTECALNAAA
jgi:hypothetical protein